jgi:hypothetical protein
MTRNEDNAADGRFSAACYSKGTGRGCTLQIFSLYSRIERSDENFPIRETFRMDMRVHFS